MYKQVPGIGFENKIQNNNIAIYGWSQSEKGRPYTYNVILRRDHATTVALEKQYVLHILSLSL